MKAIIPESVRTWTDLQVNDHFELYSDAPDVEAVADMLIPSPPQNALEIGAGLGRASAWLARTLGWGETTFWLADGDSGTKRPKVRGLNAAEAPDAFYNSFAAAREYMTVNGVDPGKVRFVEMARAARKAEVRKLRAGKVRFDLAYSIRAVGFHWPAWEALNMFHEFMRPGSRLVLDFRGAVLGSRADRHKGRLPRNRKFVDANVEWVRRDGRYWVEQWRECPAPDSGLGDPETAEHCRAYMVLRRR